MNPMTAPPTLRFGRRRIAVLLILLLGTLLAALPRPALHAAAASNPVVTENQQPGQSNWDVGSLISDDTTGQIKGYASAVSVNQNQGITFYVTVNPVQTYTIDIFRIGWYGGAGGRLRQHVGPLTGIHQNACPTDATTGLISCAWSPSYSFTVPSDWTSGIYIALLTNAAGYQNHIVFCVKDGRPATYVYQQSVLTYEAYNNYPDDKTTGKSLYDYNSYGANTAVNSPRAAKVSFDRPYSGKGSGQFLWWELQAVRWLEKSGYDVTYTTDIDTHENGAALKNSKGFLSVGHDEYWTSQMFDAVQAARDAGVGIAFFGSNTAFWQVRLEASAAGVPDRVVVCYKDANVDPIQGPTTTVNFRAAPVNRPEQGLEGVQFTSSIPFGNHLDYVVINSSHWIYNGTGLKDGDHIAGLLGYEMDRYMSNYVTPASLSRTLLSNSPFTNDGGVADYANSSIYQAPSGAWVFASGTTYWGLGLDSYNGGNADARVQQITANLLNAFVNGAPTTVDHLQVTAPATATAGQAFNVSVTAVNAQGGTVTSYNGTVHFASSDTSSAVVLPGDSTLTNGQGTFSVTLIKAGGQSLTVSDAANNLTTTSNVTVVAAPAASLYMAVPSSAKIAQPFSVTVTLSDQFGNLATGYGGTVTFWTSDPLGTLPPDYTFTPADGGRHVFSVTLRTPPSQSVNCGDTVNPNLNFASGPITVSAI